MKKYKLGAEEKETVIRSSAADKQWDIMTADPRSINKLAKRGFKQTQEKNPWGYVSFKIDFDRIRFGPAIRVRKAPKQQEEAISGE
jgi:hypothetical protein